MGETKDIQNKKINAKLYPIYKMISWDLLFYYSIIYLFLTQVKGFTAAQVLFGEAVFTASCFILQIPLGLLVDDFGKKNSLVIANVCMCIFIIILIATSNYQMLLIAYFIDAIGYVIKSDCETNILYDSLPKGKSRGKLYSQIDGLGASRYYIIDAVTSLIAGYTYVINPYIPIVLCLIANIISTILATRFRHTNMPDDGDEIIEKKESIRNYFKELNEAVKFAKSSKRMLCLLLFFGLISGLTYNMSTFRSNVLDSIKIPAQYFGVIFAVTQIAASLCSRIQSKIHKKFKNKTLTFLGMPYVFSCIIIGILANIFSEKAAPFIILLFIMQGAIKGAYNVLIYRYLNNFTNRNIRVKLSTIRNMFYNIFTLIISLIGSILLNITSSANTILTIGCITAIFMTWLTDYMRDKVGLSPEKYSEKDLKYSSITKEYK